MTESTRPLFCLAVATALSLLGSACDSTSIEPEGEQADSRVVEGAVDDGVVSLGEETPLTCVHELSERPDFLEDF